MWPKMTLSVIGSVARCLTAGRMINPSRESGRSVMNTHQDRVKDILADAEGYHRAYYQAGTFGGPSLHLHGETRQSPLVLNNPEYVYARPEARSTASVTR